MQNPFTSNQIKNYLLLYAAVVVIMVIFYLLNTSFNNIATHERKVFDERAVNLNKKADVEDAQKKDANRSSIRLLKKAY
ncbi:MAG: hypothetical protein B5M52_02435 [Helicobacteraceae bacterium 4484_230]|nr:MAG: hypothetical protein B5M52_02435 [Helicobacteraceae bacterium 4484_230]